MESLLQLRRSLRDPAVVAASFGASVLALALPFGMIQIYDRVIPNEGYATLAALGVIILAAIVLEIGLRVAREAILGRAGGRFEIEAYRAIARSLFEEDPVSARQSREGELLSRLGAIDRLRELHSGPASCAILDLPIAVLFLLFVAVISPEVALVMFIVLCFSFLNLRRYRRKVRKLHRQRLAIEARRQSYLSEVLAKADTVRALCIEDQMQRRYERLLARSAAVTASMTRAIQAAKSFTATVGLIGPLLAASVGAYFYLLGQISVGSLAAVIILTGRIVQPILQFEAYTAGADNARAAAEDFASLVQRPRHAAGDTPLFVVDEIELADVTTEPEHDTGIFFEQVSTKFEVGSCTRIVAPSSAHASAFLRLLAGECRILRGRLLVNGRDFAELRINDRALAIRLMSAHHRLLDGSLIENLTNFNETESRWEAMDLVRDIGLDRHVSASSDGFGMSVGGTGAGPLPRSLVDACGIVANLIGDPNVILFDEANAGFDREMDMRLYAMLEERLHHSVIVMVSNRPSFARLADRQIDITPWCRGRTNTSDVRERGEIL